MEPLKVAKRGWKSYKRHYRHSMSWTYTYKFYSILIERRMWKRFIQKKYIYIRNFQCQRCQVLTWTYSTMSMVNKMEWGGKRDENDQFQNTRTYPYFFIFKNDVNLLSPLLLLCDSNLPSLQFLLIPFQWNYHDSVDIQLLWSSLYLILAFIHGNIRLGCRCHDVQCHLLFLITRNSISKLD